MASVNSHEDLEVWQLAMVLAEQCYELTKRFPADERFGLTAQPRRSAVSNPSNIAEGYGRNQTGSFLQFLRVAQGSLRELDTQLALAVRLRSVAAEQTSDCKTTATRAGKTLRALIRSLEAPQ
jgi:four helix bundle protein